MNDNAYGDLATRGGRLFEPVNGCLRRYTRSVLITLGALFIALLVGVVCLAATGRLDSVAHVVRRRFDIFANSLSVVSPVLDDDPSLVIVNGDHPLPSNYTVQLTKLDNGESVSAVIYPVLQQMLDDARRDDIYPTVNAGYRTGEQQTEIMSDKVNEYYSE